MEIFEFEHYEIKKHSDVDFSLVFDDFEINDLNCFSSCYLIAELLLENKDIEWVVMCDHKIGKYRQDLIYINEDKNKDRYEHASYRLNFHLCQIHQHIKKRFGQKHLAVSLNQEELENESV